MKIETRLRRACGILERRLGADDLELSYSLENLAACCHAMGRAEEAERLASRALSIKRKRLRPDHPELGVTVSNLDVIRSAPGRKRTPAGRPEHP